MEKFNKIKGKKEVMVNGLKSIYNTMNSYIFFKICFLSNNVCEVQKIQLQIYPIINAIGERFVWEYIISNVCYFTWVTKAGFSYKINNA